MPASVVDILVVPNRGVRETDGDALSWYVENAVTMPNEVKVGNLRNWNLGKVMDACGPRGCNFNPIRQFGCYYAMVRAVPEDAHWERSDWDCTLKRTLAMSRLVHANPAGFHYCARVRRGSDDQVTSIEPQQVWGSAFGGDPSREWLRLAEWTEVGELLKRWPNSRARKVKRLLRAKWYREKYAQEKYREVRWPLLGCAIESLVGQWNGKKKPSAAFTDGLCELAIKCDSRLDSDAAKEAWRMRSYGAHGQDIPFPGRDAPVRDDELFRQVEQILGTALVKAIRDDRFASDFDGDH